MFSLHSLSLLLWILGLVSGLPRAENAVTAGARFGSVAASGGEHDNHSASMFSSLEGFLAAIYRGLGYGVKTNDPPDATPRRRELKTDSPIPGTRRVMIRTGPYIVPSMEKFALPTMERGMLWNFPDLNVEKPCTECTILKQWAGLEYPNGTNANIDTGLWLHHMIQMTVGPTRWDPVCYDKRSSPHRAMKTSPDKGERYFTAGNERTVFDFNPSGTDLSQGSGYHIGPEDSFHYLVDFMNMNMEDKTVYMTMTYDVLDGPLPKGWNGIKTFWLDVESCGLSEVKPPQETGSFEIKSQPWKPNFEGKILDSIGHLHDGGVEVKTMASNSSSLCNSKARYSESPEFKFRGKAMGDDKVATDHISSMEACQPKVQRLSKDQAWQVIGKYDYNEREGNIDHGKQGEIMAIAIVIVEVPAEGIKAPAPEKLESTGFFSWLFGSR